MSKARSNSLRRIPRTVLKKNIMNCLRSRKKMETGISLAARLLRPSSLSGRLQRLDETILAYAAAARNTRNAAVSNPARPNALTRRMRWMEQDVQT